MEGQSLNEPLRDQAWLLTISLQLIRPRSRSPVLHSITSPLGPHLLAPYKQTNYSNGYKLDPISENAPSTFFFSPSLLSSNQPAHQADYIHTRVHTHTCVHMHTLGYSLSQPSQAVYFFGPAWFYLSLYSLNLLSCAIQITDHFRFVCVWCVFCLCVCF